MLKQVVMLLLKQSIEMSEQQLVISMIEWQMLLNTFLLSDMKWLADSKNSPIKIFFGKNFHLYVTVWGQTSFKNGSMKIFVTSQKSRHFLLMKFLLIR